MTVTTRFVKQFLAIFIFFVVIGFIVFGIFRAVSPPPPTPTSDPTKLLDPISVIETRLINVKENSYDFVARLANPNPGFGSSEVQYTLTFLDSSGLVVDKIDGSFYILPRQSKYIALTNLNLPRSASSVDMSIISVDWQELDVFGSDGVSLIMVRKDYTESPEAFTFSNTEGQIYNDSDFDIAEVDVVVLVKNLQDGILALNTTGIRTFLAHTTRGFEVTWFEEFEGDVEEVLVEAHTNVFQNENFLRSHGGMERFQQKF